MRLNLPLWLIRIVYNVSACLAILLSLLLSPLILLYGLILLCLVWLRWLRRGKDVLVVFSDTPTCQKRMSQILPLVESRSEQLNWSARKMWKCWSLGPRLFDFYRFLGPPPFMLERALPAVLVFNGFGWPRRFDFSVARARDSVIERLEKALA